MSLAQHFRKFNDMERPPKFLGVQLHKPRRADELLGFEVCGKVEPSHAFTELHREGMSDSVGKR
eukprot:2682919-Heterocapsa_arctica.AAC.1